jgi:leucyl-tRNA synthetase
LHLLYSRFWHKFLYDLGMVKSKEPFQKLRHQGMVLSYSFQDSLGKYHHPGEIDFGAQPPKLKDGRELTSQVEKMSKTKLNVVNPDDVVEQYGADGLRLYEMFMGDFELPKPWDVRGIEGVGRFLARAWRVVDEWDEAKAPAGDPNLRLRHATIKAVGERIESFKFNTAIASLMEYVGTLVHGATRADLEMLAVLLAPFAPHLAEAIWERLGKPPFAATQPWPSFDPALAVGDNLIVTVQVNGKLRATLEVPRDASDDAIKELALAHPNAQKFTEGKPPKRLILVRKKDGALVNVVV